jgi:hypothetical protein
MSTQTEPNSLEGLIVAADGFSDTGRSNQEFAETYLAAAMELDRRIRPCLEAHGARRVVYTGGYDNDRNPLPFGIEYGWQPEQDAAVKTCLAEVWLTGGFEDSGGLFTAASVPDSAPQGRRAAQSELLVLDDGAPLTVEQGLSANSPRPDGGLREIVAGVLDRGAQATGEPGAHAGAPDCRASDVRLESTALNRSVLRRVTVERRAKPAPEPDLAAIRDAIEEAGGQAFVVESLNHAFDPGSLTFHPGSLTFRPGSLTFHPGSLTFHPATLAAGGNGDPPVDGLLFLAPPKVLPRPAAAPEANEAADRPDPASRPIVIGILDTGIDAVTAQGDLLGDHTWPDTFGGTPDEESRPRGRASDTYGHGTFIAGIIAQRAPLALVNHESVRNRFGQTDPYELAADLNDAWPSDIICFSFGVAARDEEEVAILHRVVQYLLDLGKVVVAAAGNISDLVDKDGNYNADMKFYPAAFKGVISVGACDSRGEPAPFAPVADWVNVWSYGVEVTSVFPEGTFEWDSGSPDGRSVPVEFPSGWATWSGSSMAAPRVAAAIAHTAATEGRSPRDIATRIQDEVDLRRAAGEPPLLIC